MEDSSSQSPVIIEGDTYNVTLYGHTIFSVGGGTSENNRRNMFFVVSYDDLGDTAEGEAFILSRSKSTSTRAVYERLIGPQS